MKPRVLPLAALLECVWEWGRRGYWQRAWRGGGREKCPRGGWGCACPSVECRHWRLQSQLRSECQQGTAEGRQRREDNRRPRGRAGAGQWNQGSTIPLSRRCRTMICWGCTFRGRRQCTSGSPRRRRRCRERKKGRWLLRLSNRIPGSKACRRWHLQQRRSQRRMAVPSQNQWGKTHQRGTLRTSLTWEPRKLLPHACPHKANR